jgi:class 3 adenylate cyclase
MGTADDLRAVVKEIFADAWRTREGQKVPEDRDIVMGNEGVKLDATVLYADLSGSTRMVDGYKPTFAAEVYKAYLRCAAAMITHHGGVITAYDGDRIMAVFIGNYKNTSAAKCGLRINWTVNEIVNPAIVAQYPKETLRVRQVVGVDTSELLVAKAGVRGANDLVWVGPAANYAAKLTELDSDYPTWITHRVFDIMNNEAKTSKDGRSRWTRRIVSIGSAPNIAAKLSGLRVEHYRSFITKEVHDNLAPSSKISRDGRSMWEVRNPLRVGRESITIYGSTFWWTTASGVVARRRHC